MTFNSDDFSDDDEPQKPLKFPSRVTDIPIIGLAVTRGVEAYRNVRRALPSLIQPVMRLLELTLLKVLEWAAPRRIPLPVRYADHIACAGLDVIEDMFNSSMIMDWMKVAVGDGSLRTDDDFFSRVHTFANEAQALATGEMKNTVRAFLELQIGLLDRIENAVERFYRSQSAERSEETFDIPGDPRTHVDRIRRIFEDVMVQRNILDYFCPGPSPLEPVWAYLHARVQALTPEETAIENFGDKIYRMKCALFAAMEYMEKASRRQQRSFFGMLSDGIERVAGFARACLPQFVVRGLSSIFSFGAVSRRLSQTEDADDARSPVSITVESETPRAPRRRMGMSHGSITDDTNAFLAVQNGKDAESGGSSDSASGLENSSEGGASDPGDLQRASRSRRRRKKTMFGKDHNSL